jgi:uncharacterized membrane protein
MRRAYIGVIIGVAIAVIWHWLGWQALVWAIGLGIVGFAIGWVVDNPGGLIRLLQRLERRQG